MTIYATGMSGTIGRVLSKSVVGLPIDLLERNFESEMPRFTHKDTLIHLAGIVGNTKVENSLRDSYKINVEGTERIAKQFWMQGGGRFIFASTSQVYSPQDTDLEESSTLAPINSYADQKLESENRLLSIFSDESERLCIARIFSVLDWDVDKSSLGGAIQKLTDPMSKFILQNGDDVRDFLTPTTIARVLENLESARNICGAVNICSGRGRKVEEAAKQMLMESGFEVPSHRLNSGHSSMPRIVGSNKKLSLALPNLRLVWQPSRLL
jgi:nucleoside-diphosphate-sugar epimerase